MDFGQALLNKAYIDLYMNFGQQKVLGTKFYSELNHSYSIALKFRWRINEIIYLHRDIRFLIVGFESIRIIMPLLVFII